MIISASINLNKIEKHRLIQGKNGLYLNVTIFVNDTPDQFGNDCSVEQRTDKGEPKIYLGNGKKLGGKAKTKEGEFQKNPDLDFLG